jgi:hypothetical protein
MRRVLGPLTALLCLPACDPDCADPARLDGLWQVAMGPADGRASLTVAQGDIADERALLWATLANGTREWEITHVPASGRTTVLVGEQTFRATREQGADNCNELALRFSGTWQGEAEHSFDWRGDLVWRGDTMAGTFTYRDTWVKDGAAGSVEIPLGELTARRLDGDTGQ